MYSYHSLSDIELSDLLWSGDSMAFTEVFNRYWDKMFLHALKMLEDEDEAKDLVQELFVSLWTKIKAGELHLQTNLSGYLYITTRNKVLNKIRQKKTRTAFEDALALYIDLNQFSVIEKINEKELAVALDAEIQNLPPKMREIFELSRKKHLSHKEIGLELNISDHTVKKQISNAIKIIRIKLGSIGGLLLILCFLFKR